MLIEMRTYTTHPGRWRDYLALFESEGLGVQQRILVRQDSRILRPAPFFSPAWQDAQRSWTTQDGSVQLEQ